MTNESTNIECPELEQMRAQYEMLKQSIDDHVQVKYYQLQKARKSYMNRQIKIGKFVFWMLLLLIPFHIYTIFSVPESNAVRSNIVSLVMEIICLICNCLTLRTNRNKLKKIESNPLEIANDLRKRRAQKVTWKNRIQIPLIPVYCFGFLWLQEGNTLFHHSPSWYVSFFVIFFLLCFVLLIWSYHRHKNYLNAVQQLDELEELKKMQ